MVVAYIKNHLKNYDPPRSPSDIYEPQFCASMPAFTARKKKLPDVKRKSSQDKDNEIIVSWLDQLWYFLDTHTVLPENILKFNEGGFMFGVGRGDTVYVHNGATAPHTILPEDCKQVTITEVIHAVVRAIRTCITLEGEYHMESWQNEFAPTGEKIFLLRNSGYTNDQLGL
ncbi:hypothetical protein GcM3_028028 [Golovinomyces cichoracearum]|uniref:Uncharacterized protein n=1 Tax=Golovinomyces cichoracearum TaxID=62708 RepID=A0A420J5N8_9PEZI|nr:hypothetical protein GcM3_028028 [Golovinomyces cichoracearum]